MKKVKTTHYGLMTVITMIIGTCIGSGIFFKADDILRYTGGNVSLGVLVLCLGAMSIIFGSLTLTELAGRTDKNGGLVGYFEAFVSKELASAFGWFLTFLYYPSISVVVSWVAGIYTFILFNVEATLEAQIMMGIFYLICIYGLHFTSTKLGGLFQIVTTYIKLFALISLSLLGFFWRPELAEAVLVKTVNLPNSWFWLAALAPTAFSYEGWSVATSISNEVKNAKKNMPIALIVGPVIILAVYVMYFIGITNIVGPDYLLKHGDEAIYHIGQALLGKVGGALITMFVLIAILGVINGLTMGSIRMPQALASKGFIPFAAKIKPIQLQKQLSTVSFFTSLVIALLWMGIHYLTQKYQVLPGSDISEIAIVFGYLCYAILYIRVLKMYFQKEIKSVFKGLIAPIFALLGSAIIVVGGVLTNPLYVPIFMIICCIFCLAGWLYYNRHKSRLNN